MVIYIPGIYIYNDKSDASVMIKIHVTYYYVIPGPGFAYYMLRGIIADCVK